jgi:hypothetical protein
VIVNRIWMHHFGKGLVDTPSDLGTRGSPPSHPELLDWLAAEFLNKGQGLKWLHRMIACSSVYRQESKPSELVRERDAENRLLSHANRRRLEFEAMRDAVLATSGTLEPRVGGPSFVITAATASESSRRTLYARIDRQELPVLYRTFDFPDPQSSSPSRDQTTVPPQALFWLNHPLLAAAARGVISSVDVSRHAGISDRVEAIYRRVLLRPPESAELELSLQFLGEEPDGDAFELLAHSLLMTNEFIMID